MKHKFYLITAALLLTLTACSATNDPLEVKIEEVLSKSGEIENTDAVNNGLLVDNSVENVENYPSNSNPDVENSPDNTDSEDKNGENHSLVKDFDNSDSENQ